jgi:predicted DNA-binding transcriptional regulator AlpA
MIPNPAEQPVVSAEEAFAQLGIDRTTGYRAIREGTFPLEVIRIGRAIRVPTKALRRLLQFDEQAEPDVQSAPTQ